MLVLGKNLATKQIRLALMAVTAVYCLSASCATLPTLAVSTSGSPSTYGGAVTFTANFSTGTDVTVTFYDGTTAIGTGAVHGKTATLTTSSLTAGSHTITAIWPGNSNYSAITSNTITQVVNTAIPAITWATPSSIPYGTALSSTQLNASSIVAGTFSYLPAAGTVLTAGSHTITATFTPTNTADYTSATSSVSITVAQSTPTITWATPSSIPYGTALSSTQLNASSIVAGTFSYLPAAGTVLTAGSHTITATFTPTDTTDYTSATSSVSIAIARSTPAITWATPSSVPYGTALSSTQLNASSTVAGTFSYLPAAGTVLTAGSHTITATFTPTDTTDYATATSSVSLIVSMSTPVITWATPTAVTLGTALSSIQLDATSTVPGTFVYLPTSGTILAAAGSQTLSVTFTPTDTTDYTTATQTVTLLVNSGSSTLSVNATSVPFGTVEVDVPATQTVTLTSTGSGPVTVNAATLTGAGFTMSGITFPVTLASGQAATLTLQFDPATATTATGQLTITSNSSTNATTVIPLSGTGTAPVVDLSWYAPAVSADPVTGYDVYRSPMGSSSYALLNSTIVGSTSYVDNTVQSGQSYDYMVASVDANGLQSSPSNVITVSIP